MFSADLSRFRAMTSERLRRILVRSVADIMSSAQLRAVGVTAGGTLIPGRMPVVSTALVTSLLSMCGGATFKGEFSYDLALAKYQNGNDLAFRWTEPYAHYIEHGDENFSGWHYLGANAARWPEVVLKNARRIRSRGNAS